MDLDNWDVVVRLTLAAALGAIIGINRDMAGKAMGSRTLGLVSLSTASVALAAVEIQGIGANPDALSRIVQGIIQGVMGGISFIGAGVIIRNPQTHTVDGLTTAATVWATAALGIACAFGAWLIVTVASVLALVLLVAPSASEKVGTKSASSTGEIDSNPG